ncbi:hypothetical protein MIND_00817900 [Mycena indigotica]|uniref:Uncharacterized protein n=1 Tax=Mycena indigotica TaxID=2126181 RepID=A0A8H6SIZ2_9AGAR|nr:uncharacterized protein MIND_00817900 [Mycena indigotica]KAF7298705.1 hypothetical protein MIND_00817900 [Mycena indigotica]
MGYAHFQVHTDDSLTAMQTAWEKMHENLPVFRELGPECSDFNIPKLHNIRHYIDSIRLLGSADGYNTENTERLHIDLAKNGYRASNRRDYIQQMTRWLTRQEAVHRFSLYLQWACPGYSPGQGYRPPPNVDWDDWEQADDADNEEDEAFDETPQQVTYDIAARPAYPNLSASDIQTQFQVRDFLFYVNEFLNQHKLPGGELLRSTRRFGAFKRAALYLPALRAAETESEKPDVIQAILAADGTMSNKGLKRGSPAKFSTVLVRISDSNWKDGPLSGNYFVSLPLTWLTWNLLGLQVAHVKLIFRLPMEIMVHEAPLLYVHWFTPFHDMLADFESPSGLSRISHSNTVGQRRSSVISLADVVQTCHLIPKFATTTNPDWDCNRVLNQVTTFYFNPYLRYRDFYLFRYNMYLITEYHKRKQAELAAKLARGANNIRF